MTPAPFNPGLRAVFADKSNKQTFFETVPVVAVMIEGYESRSGGRSFAAEILVPTGAPSPTLVECSSLPGFLGLATAPVSMSDASDFTKAARKYLDENRQEPEPAPESR